MKFKFEKRKHEVFHWNQVSKPNFQHNFFNGKCHSQNNFMYMDKIHQNHRKKSSARLTIHKICLGTRDVLAGRMEGKNWDS